MKSVKRVPRWQDQKYITYAGVHIVADFWFGKSVENSRFLKQLLLEAAKKSLSTPLKFSFKKFIPHGITGILLLSESHIALHSWPEIHYLAIDIFTCGKKSNPECALKFLKEQLQPKRVSIREIKRGTITREFAKSL